jgi:hypothetical protein
MEKILAVLIVILLLCMSTMQRLFRNTRIYKIRKPVRATPTAHANDPENVHDRGIVNSITRKFKRLIELYEHNPECLDVEFTEGQKHSALLEAYTAAQKYEPSNRDRIIEFLNRVSEASTVTSLDQQYGIITDEATIFMLVWCRIHHPSNYQNRENLLSCLFQQILDASARGHLVCLSGRISRVVSCLTLLDADPVLSSPELDNHEVANLAYLAASNIIQQELVAWQSKYPDIQTWYQSTYEESEESARVVSEFQTHCRRLIEKNIKESFANMISDLHLNSIIQNAVQAV